MPVTADDSRATCTRNIDPRPRGYAKHQRQRPNVITSRDPQAFIVKVGIMNNFADRIRRQRHRENPSSRGRSTRAIFQRFSPEIWFVNCASRAERTIANDALENRQLSKRIVHWDEKVNVHRTTLACK